jgi:FtsP/CotA-like multicopper oxidase with cupredoxin domain
MGDQKTMRGEFATTWTVLPFLVLGAVGAVLGAPLLSAQTTLNPIAASLSAIAANDNRTPAGALNSSVLTLRLDIRKGLWYPEGDDGEAIAVYAFAEAGKTLQIPGPTVRVPQGTTLDIVLHNQLSVPATVYGLHQRPGNGEDTIKVAAGASEHVRFVAGAPGTYLYQARTPDGSRNGDRVLDSQLGGALVVDTAGASVRDRIFVLQRWSGTTRTEINGKSWPYTEQLTGKVGEEVLWRIINASDQDHPMHLHGGAFQLAAVSNGELYTSNPPGAQPSEFTHSVAIGETFDLRWTPTEPGQWLFHCHRVAHMRVPIELDQSDVVGVAFSHVAAHDTLSHYAAMGGMVLGINVTGPSKIDTVSNWKPERQLALTVAPQSNDSRFYQLSLGDLVPAPKATPQVSTGLAGPVMVLTQDQPVEITVVNKLKEPTVIHWHGIELESYYDGVPVWGGLGGIGDRKSPAVEPGQSFVVRMTPPRAGTFMYHTHWHDGAQITGGVDGILVVMPAGEKYDPATDKSFILSVSGNQPFGAGMLLMNGAPQLATMQLKTGTTYRLRFANITPGVNTLRVSLRQAGAPVEWRLTNKDAFGVAGTPMKTADQVIAIGETFDFEYRASSPQTLTLEGVNPNNNLRAVQTLVFTNP